MLASDAPGSRPPRSSPGLPAHWRSHAGAGVCILALLAAGHRQASAQVVRDSAGLQIVENQNPLRPAASALTLAVTPALVIGNENSEPYQFSRIGGAVRLADGTLVVADGGSSELRFFDPRGQFIRSAGRRGHGPGEFTRLDLLARVAGDTLVAGTVLGAHSYFTSEGDFVRQVNPRTIRDASLPPGPRFLLGVFQDQSLLIATVPPVRHHSGMDRWTDSMQVYLVDRTATKVRPVGTFPFLTYIMVDGLPSAPWFAPTAAFALSGRTLYVGFGSEYAVRVYSAGGTLQRIIRRRWSPQQVSHQDIDNYVAEWSRRWIRKTGAAAEQERRELRDSPFARIVPAFSQFMADRAGRLWVREAHLADAPGDGSLNGPALVPSIWSVFDTRGRWLADVTMPAHFRPKEIGADYVLGVARDADGIESVVLYRLERGGR